MDSVPEFDWQAFGKSFAQHSSLDHRDALFVPFVAQAVSRQLKSLGIQPNSDEAGRDYARETFGIGHSSIGTCGDVSRALQKSLIGAGVDDSLLEIVAGRKPLRLNGLPDLSDFYNIDHASLIYFGEARPAIYDLWLDGTSQGEYGRFEDSPWCGATFDAWLGAAHQLGYAHFAFDVDSTLEDLEPPTDRVAQTWRERRSAIDPNFR